MSVLIGVLGLNLTKDLFQGDPAHRHGIVGMWAWGA